MTTEDFLKRRARELCEFFQGYFGKGWRSRVRERAHVEVPSSWLRGELDFASAALRRAEAFAQTLGYRPDCFVPPFERKRFDRLNCLTCAISSQALAHSVYTLSWRRAFLDFPYHGKPSVSRNSDVLSDEIVQYRRKGERSRHPCVGKPTAPALPSTVAEVFDLPVPLPPNTPGPRPAPGGEPTSQPSLGASRAEQKVTREPKVRHVVSARKVLDRYKNVRPWQRRRVYRGAVKRLIRQCNSDEQLSQRERELVLAQCHRFIEGTLSRNELREKLSDSVDI